MSNRDLDNYITGHYGEDQFKNDEPSDDDECLVCEAKICKHGICDCDEESCPECCRHREAEAEAQREADYQRNVIGPLMGWKEDEK